MDKNITFVHAKTLQEARYQLKTALEVSEDYYMHCKIFPIFGSSQGATNLPGMWLAISSTIGDVYNESAHGVECVGLDQAISVLLTILGFANDVTNQIVNYGQHYYS
eukprot:15364555-Ditylum_brightwellii.AAC.1